MNAVFLDYGTIDRGDLDRASLETSTGPWQWFEQTGAEELPGRIREARILVTNKVPLDRETILSAPRLELICIAATGTDKVDLEAARELGVPVCNVTGYATPSVVQHVFALLLALTTRLIDYHQDVQRGRWQAQEKFCLLDHPIEELAGKRLGILGYGELGQAVARAAAAFGLQVLVSQRPGSKRLLPGRFLFERVVEESDILSLHLPLTPQTRNLIGASELARMKPGALLINTARGGIVDEEALAGALRSGHLGGAGVDVLTEEPPRAENPLLPADLPNLIVTPHVAWASRQSRQRLLDGIAANILAFREGRTRNCVNCGESS